MTDIGCSIPESIIIPILTWIKSNVASKFLILTKNPTFFEKYAKRIPRNCVLGTTIETDRSDFTSIFSMAPPPQERLSVMKWVRNNLPNERVLVIEPIMKFTEQFSNEINSIEAKWVVIGYDNYRNSLPEPEEHEVDNLILKINKSKIIKKNMKKNT